MILNNKYPHAERWLPVYWEDAEKANLPANEMHSKFYAYSAGGRTSSPTIKSFYNNLVQFYGNHFGVQYPFNLKDKSSYLPERTNI